MNGHFYSVIYREIVTESLVVKSMTAVTTILAKIPWNNRKIACFYPRSSQELLSPPLPHSMLKKLAGSTSGSFVNTLCNIEMGEWGELKIHISIFLSKVDLFQHFWPRLSEFWPRRSF